MKVVLKKPNKPAEIVTIPGRNNLDQLRSLISEDPKKLPWMDIAVRGNNMFDNGNGIICYCDDEGLLKKLELNFFRPTDLSPIVGNVVAVKTDEEGNDLDMTGDEAKAVCTMLDTWAMYSGHLEKESN